MEIALEVGMLTYSGGLGILVGDTIRAAADLHLPMVAVTLLHRMIEEVNRAANAGLDVDVLTLGCARRATVYKRLDLLFQDSERLKQLATRTGGLQVIDAGRAHPQDQPGKTLIQHIHEVKGTLQDTIKIAYLANYDVTLMRMTRGAWWTGCLRSTGPRITRSHPVSARRRGHKGEPEDRASLPERIRWKLR